MITGTVTADREAVLHVAVVDPGGHEYVARALVDTGYNGWLTLPSDLIARLGLKWVRKGSAILADGSAVFTNLYEATIVWDSQPLPVLVDAVESDPLIGMSLMYGYELLIPIIDGSMFTLRSLSVS
jgi:clan AA aspartic protease